MALPSFSSPYHSPFIPSPRAPIEQAPSAKLQVAEPPPTNPDAPVNSGQFRARHAAPYTPKELTPPVNLEFHSPRSCARTIFSKSGEIGLHRRRVYCVEPELNSCLRELPLGTLYLPQSLTCPLFFLRSLPPWTSPCRRWLPSPARLRSPHLLSTTPVCSRYPMDAHAPASSLPTPP